jgi:hypothetical protein
MTRSPDPLAGWRAWRLNHAVGPAVASVSKQARPAETEAERQNSAIVSAVSTASTHTLEAAKPLAAADVPRLVTDRHTATLGLATLRRPHATANPGDVPSPRASCVCCSRLTPCNGGRWWCEIDTPKGWRCWTCHPPDHLPPSMVREVRT